MIFVIQAARWLRRQKELKAMGARTVYACISHAVLSKDAMDKIQNSEFAEAIMTDTIPLRGEPPAKLKIVSAAPILSQAIKLAGEGGSISSLFEVQPTSKSAS